MKIKIAKRWFEFTKKNLSKYSWCVFIVLACRLQDLEKQCEEYKEKAVILKLFNKREKSYIKELETLLLNIKDAYRMILTKKSDNEILLKVWQAF